MESVIGDYNMATKPQHIVNHLSQTEKKWFAIYTKYRGEKYVVEQLHKKQIDAYVPLLQRTKKYDRKIKTYEIPLINSYAFVCITKNEYVQVLETQHVIHFVKQRQNLVSIPHKEMELMKRIVGEKFQVNLYESPFCKGKKVEIISGSLTGLQGILIEVRGKKSVVVELEQIGYQLQIEIDVNLLRSLD